MGNQKEFIAQVEKLKREFEFAAELAVQINADRLKLMGRVEELEVQLKKATQLRAGWIKSKPAKDGFYPVQYAGGGYGGCGFKNGQWNQGINDNKIVAHLVESPAEQPVVSQDAHEKEVMMQAFDKVRRLFEGREWIMEGRGSYPYNDDRYKEEVRYMYDEFDQLQKDTWANIKSKSVEYREKIIAEYLHGDHPAIPDILKRIGYQPIPEQPVREVDDWVSVDERLPELTEPLTWWDDETNQRDVIIPNHHAIVLAYNLELGVYKAKLEGKMWSEISSRSIVSTKETIPTHWKPLPQPPAEWSGEKEK